MDEIKDICTRIIEAFSSDRCPLCGVLRMDEFNSLWQWAGHSGENDKNSEKRKQLINAGGFCSYHFWRFKEMCTDYGIASICTQLIEKLLEILKTGKQWAVKCPVCSELSQKESEYFSQLLFLLKDGHASKYEESSGLCIWHYMKIREFFGDDPILEFLHKSQLNQLEKIKINAAGLIAKQEPPLNLQQTDDEKHSPLRTTWKMAGLSGLYYER